MEKVTIVKVYRSNKDKQGNILKTQDGREYTRLAIQTKEHGQKWISGFGNSKNSDWKAGDSVDIIIEPNGEYLNFKMPKDINELEARVAKLEEDVKAILEYTMGKDPGEPPSEEAPF